MDLLNSRSSGGTSSNELSVQGDGSEAADEDDATGDAMTRIEALFQMSDAIEKARMGTCNIVGGKYIKIALLLLFDYTILPGCLRAGRSNFVVTSMLFRLTILKVPSVRDNTPCHFWGLYNFPNHQAPLLIGCAVLFRQDCPRAPFRSQSHVYEPHFCTLSSCNSSFEIYHGVSFPGRPSRFITESFSRRCLNLT